jgi:hypothetical protein
VRAEAEAEKIAEQLKKTKVSGCTLFTFFILHLFTVTSNSWQFNYCSLHGLGVIYMLHFQNNNFIKALAIISFNVGSSQVFSVQMLMARLGVPFLKKL